MQFFIGDAGVEQLYSKQLGYLLQDIRGLEKNQISKC
jgi:hypothetical protein